MYLTKQAILLPADSIIKGPHMYRNTGARLTNVSFRIVDIANHARYSTPVQLETQMITVHPSSLEMHRNPSEHIGTLLCSKYTRLKQGIAVSHHYNSKNR